MGISPLLATVCDDPDTASVRLAQIKKRTAAAAKQRAAAAEDKR